MDFSRLIKPWSNSKYQLSVSQEYKLTEYDLAQPLSEAERKLNDWYNDRIAKQGALLAAEGETIRQAAVERREPTPTEKSILAASAKQRADCALCSSEELTWLKLRARQGWQKELADYRWSVEDSAFANYQGQLSASWSGGFNLPTMIEQYEHLKAVQQSPEARFSLAQRKLNTARRKLVQLTEEESELFQELKIKKDLGEMRLAILCEVLEKVFKKFIEHVLLDTFGEQPTTEHEVHAEQLPVEKPLVSTEDTHAKDIAIDFQFENLTLEDCQILCTAVGLDDEAQSYKPARAWGLAEVLVYYDFAAKGRTAELVQALGRAFGIKMKSNYAPDNLNQARKGARITANAKLLSIQKIDKESHDALHKKQGKPQITRTARGQITG